LVKLWEINNKHIDTSAYALAATYTPDEIEECTIEGDLMRSKTLMSILKTIVFTVFFSATCCISIWCSYNQLWRKYEKLENKRKAFAEWLASVKNDPEGGGAKNVFAKKLNQLRKGAKKF